MSEPNSFSVVESDLLRLVGSVVSEDEMPHLMEAASVFKYSVEKSLTWFLENLSKYRTIVGFLSARAENIYREEVRTLERISSRKYNSHRKAGQTSKIGKPPPAEALKHLVRSDSEFLEQQAVVSRAEYHRDLLRVLKDTMQTKSREVDQICNNIRLEIRTDLEE